MNESCRKNPRTLFQDFSRREFMKLAARGGGALILMGRFGLLCMGQSHAADTAGYQMILVDYEKCTGCRTCETVCSAWNHRQTVNGETLNGLGNPFYSNIKVYGYNPDVDIPSVCAMCPDHPCIESCPVKPDPKTGRRALYRDEKRFTITNDLARCIGCGNCAMACRVGGIVPNPSTGKPERICRLCDGNPQCVKYCPYGALSCETVDTDREFYGMKPDQIAQALTRRWYHAGGERYRVSGISYGVFHPTCKSGG